MRDLLAHRGDARIAEASWSRGRGLLRRAWLASALLLFFGSSAYAQPARLTAPNAVVGPHQEDVEDLDLLHRNYTYPVDRPTPPGDHFSPPLAKGSPSRFAPRIASFTRQAPVDAAVVIHGADLTRNIGASANRDTRIWMWNQTTPHDGQLFEAQLLNSTPETVTAMTKGVSLPALHYGMFMVWAQNGSGTSHPVRVNATDAWWLGPYHAEPGDEVSIYGRNLSQDDGTQTTYVYYRPWGAGPSHPSVLCDRCIKAVSPYKVTFQLPPSMTAGADQEIWIHNGHGGDFGWSGPLRLRVDPVPKQTIATIDVPAPVQGDSAPMINRLLATAPSGAIVKLGAGTYGIASPLVVPEGVTFRGLGKDRTFVQTLQSASYTADSMIRVRSKSGVRISDMTVRASSGAKIVDAMVLFNGYGSSVYPVGASVSDVRFETADAAGVPHPNSDIVALQIAWYEDVHVRRCTFIGGTMSLLYARYAFIHDNEYKGTVLARTPVGREGNSAGTGYGSMNSRYVDFSRNTATSFDRPGGLFARRLYSVGSNWWPSVNHYIGDNVSRDCSVHPSRAKDPNSGENINVESGRTNIPLYIGKPAKAPKASSTALAFSGVKWKPNQWSMTPRLLTIGPASIAVIARGPGTGQWRRIVSSTKSAIVVDRPWDVPPTAESTVLIQSGFFRVAVYRNSLQGPYDDDRNGVPDYSQYRHLESSGVTIYGNGADVIVADNSMRWLKNGVVASGFARMLKGKNPYHAPQHGTVIAGNTIVGAVAGVRLQTNMLVDPASGAPPGDDPGVGPTMLNTLVRGNFIYGAVESGIRIAKLRDDIHWPRWQAIVQNSVFESNYAPQAEKVVELADMQWQTVVHKNELPRRSPHHGATASPAASTRATSEHPLVPAWSSAKERCVVRRGSRIVRQLP